jgi:hypothetical protein
VDEDDRTRHALGVETGEHAGQRDRDSGDLASRLDERLAPPDEPRVRARPADVDREGVLVARPVAEDPRGPFLPA